MKKVSLAVVRAEYVRDGLTRPNNKSSNEPLIKLIDLINNPNATIDVIEGKGGLLSRGVVAECLIKIYLLNLNASQWASTGYDMEYKGLKCEIKYSSAKGYAHYNPQQDMTNLVFMDRYGIYLTSGKEIVLDKCGKHIQTINKNNATKLVDFH